METISEFELLATLAALHAGAAHPCVELAIGDDAAVLALEGRVVWTVDTQVDHVHFERGWLSAEDIGFRAHAAATSDVYAMGGRPTASLVGYILPPDSGGTAEGLARGARDSAGHHGAPTVGGNLSAGRELSITTTVLGTCDAPKRRSGAQVGDGIYVAGKLGHAAVGLHALANGLAAASAERFVAAWRRPMLPVVEARALGQACAAIDVSDGVCADLGHILSASGVGARLEAKALVDDALARAARDLDLDALALALRGGEDYAILATSSAALPGFRRIGTIVDGALLELVDPRGRTSALDFSGHAHRF